MQSEWTSFVGLVVARSLIYKGGVVVGQATSKEAQEAIVRLLDLCSENFSIQQLDHQGRWVGGESWQVSAWW